MQAGHQQGNQKRHHNGDIIKAHVDMKTVLKQQAEPEVDDQEYPDRQQGKGIAFFILFLLLSTQQTKTLPSHFA